MLIRVLFLSLIKVNGEYFAVKIDGLLFHPSLCKGLNANLRTFFVTCQGKRRRVSLRKNVTFFSQNQLALLESRPSAGFLVGLRWNKDHQLTQHSFRRLP